MSSLMAWTLANEQAVYGLEGCFLPDLYLEISYWSRYSKGTTWWAK
jgi:hypothetical protein